MIQYRAMAAERGQSGSRACLCSRVAAARSDLPGGKQLGSPSLARSRGPGVHVRVLTVDWHQRALAMLRPPSPEFPI